MHRTDAPTTATAADTAHADPTGDPAGSCRFCGSVTPHRVERCDAVKAVEYHPDGSLARVEKFSPAERAVTHQPLPYRPMPMWPGIPTPPHPGTVWISETRTTRTRRPEVK